MTGSQPVDAGSNPAGTTAGHPAQCTSTGRLSTAGKAAERTYRELWAGTEPLDKVFGASLTAPSTSGQSYLPFKQADTGSNPVGVTHWGS